MNIEVSKLIAQQIVHEFGSAYLYLDFSTFFAEKGLHGFCNWFRIQAQEEISHGLRFLRYLEDNTEHVELCQDIKASVRPGSMDIPGILTASFAHEQMITRLIEAIYATAASARDLRTLCFLDWFITEQAEEEKNASDLIQAYENYGSTPASLYLLDQELAKRVSVATTLG